MLKIEAELGSSFDWYSTKDKNRKSLRHYRHNINLLNYSPAYAAYVTALSTGTKDKSIELSRFLPFPGLWEIMHGDVIDLSVEVATEVLSTYEDAPMGAYICIEAIKGQLLAIINEF